MVDGEELRALLERVGKATGPDRRLDYEIFAAFASHGIGNLWDPKAGHFYTASIDAAVALVEKVLPGIRWVIASKDDVWDEPCGCTLKMDDDNVDGEGATVPLAICSALLRALQADQTDAGRSGR